MTDLDKITCEKLICEAMKAREEAYAPYSHFKVGAAILCKNGRIFKGCNIENVSFSATNCAERTAVFSAVASGCREFSAIAIAADEKTILPCGICRQVLLEFAPDITVICKSGHSYKTFKLCELLPHSFDNFTPEEK